MKKSTVKGKSATRSKKKPLPTKKPTKKKDKKKPEVPGLAEADQPLFYYGPPPAIKATYKKLEYDSDFHPQDLVMHMQQGSSRSEICAAWGITYSMFNDWLDQYPELGMAFATGRPAFDAYYKRALRHAAFGQMKGVNEKSLFFMLKNQAGFTEDGGDHEYADGQNADIEFVDDDEL